jgi:hypothetical protein
MNFTANHGKNYGCVPRSGSVSLARALSRAACRA